MKTRSRFDSIPTLLDKANPTTQKFFGRQPEVAVGGDFPTLIDLRMALGNGAPEQWLYVQIADMTVYAGARNLTKRQQGQLADGIAAEYGWLNVAEVLLFFHRFKMGRYGVFYGNVDPMVVTCALRKFVGERNDMLAQLEQQQRERRMAEERRTAETFTREEWAEIKAIIAMYNPEYTI